MEVAFDYSFHFILIFCQLNREPTKNLLDDHIEELDFKQNSETSQQYINYLVEQATKGHITESIPSSAVNARSLAIITNVASFKGAWVNHFNHHVTLKPFYGINRTKDVEMMKRVGIITHGKKSQKFLRYD